MSDDLHSPETGDDETPDPFWWMNPALWTDWAAWRKKQAKAQKRMSPQNASTAIYAEDFTGRWTGDPHQQKPDPVPPPPRPGMLRLP